MKGRAFFFAMGRTKNIGKVMDVEKIWLNKKEAAAYLGVSERYIDANINTNPQIDIYRISERVFLYDKRSIDRMVLKSKI